MDRDLLDWQTERFRTMTADEKYTIVRALWAEARAATEAGVRGRYPLWSDEQVAVEVRRLMSYAGD